VTSYIQKNMECFTLENYRDLSGYRYTLDTQEDFNTIRYLITELKKKKWFGFYEEICSILEK